MARRVALLVAALTAGAVSLGGGAAAASHQAARLALPDATSPSWSPDGKQIVFARVRASCCGDWSGYRIVRRSSKPGGAVRTVLAGKGTCCVQVEWGTRGRIVALTGSSLKSVGVHGGKPKKLVSPACSVCGSPTGFILSPNREIAAVSFCECDTPPGFHAIELVRLRPGKAPTVLPTPLPAEEQSLDVSDSVVGFSPDGRQLIFLRCQFWWDPTAACDPMAARIPDGTPVPLAESGVPGASLLPNDVRQIEWSPDGRWVTYDVSHGLEVVATSGASEPHVLATCPDTEFLGGSSWSPTSKLFAYECVEGTDGGGRIFTVRPDGTHLTDLLKRRLWTYVGNYGGEPVPQWSPDGSRLLVLASQAPPDASTFVFTIRPNGHGLTWLG